MSRFHAYRRHDYDEFGVLNQHSFKIRRVKGQKQTKRVASKSDGHSGDTLSAFKGLE